MFALKYLENTTTVLHVTFSQADQTLWMPARQRQLPAMLKYFTKECLQLRGMENAHYKVQTSNNLNIEAETLKFDRQNETYTNFK